jgi:hypothetical protein
VEAFVYKWINKLNGKSYIGYHKGETNDGYVSSSKNKEFWEDYQIGNLERIILFLGTMEECVTYESQLLQSADFTQLYNRNRNGKIIFTEDVLEKLRLAGNGRKQSPEHIEARRKSLQGRNGGFAGKKHSKETIEKMKSVKRTEEHKKAISEATKGRKGSFTGMKHPTAECPHCKKVVAVCSFGRWHGDNCRYK